MSSKGSDRRKYPRTDKHLEIQLSGDANKSGLARVINISAAGILCLATHRFEVMTRLAVLLNIPYEDNGASRSIEIECEGVVVRSERSAEPIDNLHYETAVYFTRMSPEDKKNLTQLVEEHLQSIGVHAATE